MYQITSGARGGGLPAGLGVYEFIFRMDEGSESYMNFQSKRGGDNSGGERVVESISLLERRICVTQCMWCRLCGAICGEVYVVSAT